MNERDLQDMRDAYEPTDPKHPDWAGHRGPAFFFRADHDVAMANLVPRDEDLKRLKEAGFEVYGWVPMEADE